MNSQTCVVFCVALDGILSLPSYVRWNKFPSHRMFRIPILVSYVIKVLDTVTVSSKLGQILAAIIR